MRFMPVQNRTGSPLIRFASLGTNSEQICGFVVSRKNNESWNEVCAQVATKPNPRKLIKLIRELCLLLDAKHQRATRGN